MAELEKAWGCLAGLALGDALGMPSEFLTPSEIVAAYGRIEGLVRAPAGHPHASLPLGRVTDDTEQALALAGVYLRQGCLDAEAVAQALLDWEAHQGDAALYIGPSTRQALDALRAGASPRESGRNGKTNGAAMRIAPVGIVHAGDRESTLRDTVEACLPTHGTTLAISGAAAIAFAVGEAMVKGAMVQSVLAAARDGARRGRQFGAWTWTPPLEERIDLAVGLVDKAQDEEQALNALYAWVGVDLTVAESVPTALGLVALARGDPMRAVRLAANLGGDTDTIGAMAGAVCGALRGIDAVDQGLLAVVEGTNHLDLEGIACGLIAAAGSSARLA